MCGRKSGPTAHAPDASPRSVYGHFFAYSVGSVSVADPCGEALVLSAVGPQRDLPRTFSSAGVVATATSVVYPFRRDQCGMGGSHAMASSGGRVRRTFGTMCAPRRPCGGSRPLAAIGSAAQHLAGFGIAGDPPARRPSSRLRPNTASQPMRFIGPILTPGCQV